MPYRKRCHRKLKLESRKKVSEYDQEIPQSHSAGQLTAL